MASADEIREAQRAAWAGLSASWEKWDPIIMEQLGPVGAAMIERLDIAEDQHHLDIAAGTGEPGLSIARLANVDQPDAAAEKQALAEESKKYHKRDTVAISSAKLLPDGHTVELELAGMKPSMQLKVTYDLEDTEGTVMKGAVHATVYPN